MPGEILTPGPEAPPQAGFFGKLATTGDFVARGLPDGFRRNWDAWVTRHLAPRQRDGSNWPDGGIRFRLASGGRVAAGVIVPGRDSAGRSFPLSLILIGDHLPAPDALDPWCDAAAALIKNAVPDPDALWQGLDDLPPPADSATDEKLPGLLLWAKDVAPQPGDPGDPHVALAAVFD